MLLEFCLLRVSSTPIAGSTFALAEARLQVPECWCLACGTQESIMMENDNIGATEVSGAGAILWDNFLSSKIWDLAPLEIRSKPADWQD